MHGLLCYVVVVNRITKMRKIQIARIDPIEFVRGLVVVLFFAVVISWIPRKFISSVFPYPHGRFFVSTQVQPQWSDHERSRPLFTYRKISWSLEAARLVVIMTVSVWNWTGISAALLPMCMSNFGKIGKVETRISRLRNFTRSCGKTSVYLVNRGPG